MSTNMYLLYGGLAVLIIVVLIILIVIYSKSVVDPNKPTILSNNPSTSPTIPPNIEQLYSDYTDPSLGDISPENLTGISYALSLNRLTTNRVVVSSLGLIRANAVFCIKRGDLGRENFKSFKTPITGWVNIQQTSKPQFLAENEKITANYESDMYNHNELITDKSKIKHSGKKAIVTSVQYPKSGFVAYPIRCLDVECLLVILRLNDITPDTIKTAEGMQAGYEVLTNVLAILDKYNSKALPLIIVGGFGVIDYPGVFKALFTGKVLVTDFKDSNVPTCRVPFTVDNKRYHIATDGLVVSTTLFKRISTYIDFSVNNEDLYPIIVVKAYKTHSNPGVNIKPTEMSNYINRNITSVKDPAYMFSGTKGTFVPVINTHYKVVEQ